MGQPTPAYIAAWMVFGLITTALCLYVDRRECGWSVGDVIGLLVIGPSVGPLIAPICLFFLAIFSGKIGKPRWGTPK